MERLIMKAERGDVYLFPEMCSTGFCMQPEEVAEPVDGPTVQKFKEWARMFDAAIAGTVMTRECDGVFRNRMYFVTPDGEVRFYDKCHLFEYSGEDRVYTPGDRKVIWEWRGVRFRPVICYDIRFPIFLHNTGDYDVMLVSANFPEKRMLAWDVLIRARAIENQCYVAASNRVGLDDYGTYVGHSVILNPYGQTIARCRSRYQGSATAELEWGMMERLRRNFPVLNNDKAL
jgi:predicted amidohydrolase